MNRTFGANVPVKVELVIIEMFQMHVTLCNIRGEIFVLRCYIDVENVYDPENIDRTTSYAGQHKAGKHI